ncbi:MAG: FGGY family carbohydrate kinase [Desulfobacterales bacterium]|jgi:glycerol kinase|nr:FGGY family carbohydrate kinase [Desulfobacterales bacterium]
MGGPAALIIDQGTHATRAMVMAADGQIRHSAFADVSLFRLSDTRVEQDAEEILSSVHRTVARVLKESAAGRLEIDAAGLATQRSSVVAWDRETGNPLSPVISWQDCRVGRWLNQFRKDASRIQQLSGLPLSPHYGAGKLRWLLDNVPAIKTAHMTGRLVWGPLAGFLIFHLVKNRPYLVDHANAQRTQLWNIQTRNWDDELITLFQLPKGNLPTCMPVCGYYGKLTAADIPLRVVSGDQGAAYFSMGRMNVHKVLINIGTGAFLLAPTGEKPVYRQRLLSGLVASEEGRAEYVLEGTVNGAGAALDWAQKKWGIRNLSENLPDWLSRETRLPVFLNAVGGIGSPWWRADMASRLIGDGETWQRAVAVAESILFLIQSNLDAMAAAGCDIKQLVVTGGLARLDGLCRRLADLSGKPVYRPAETEATVRGTAWLVFGRPKRWPKSGRGRWFAPLANAPLKERYFRFCTEMKRTENR